MTRRIAAPPAAAPPPLGDQGQFTAQAPTDGRELMAAWELPPEAFTTESVKTFRPKPGTRIEEIVNSCPIPEWNLDDLAARFGPGTYRVAPGPGPYRTKTATIHVSDEYARACGWGAPPPAAPRASEAVAVRTLQNAVSQPTNPLDLMAAIETMMDRREAALLARIAPQQMQNPMEAFAIFKQGFDAASSFTEKGLALAQRITGQEPAEREPESWAGVFKAALPGLLQAFSNMTAPRPVMPQHPAMQPHRPAPPPAAGTLPPSNPAPAAPPPEVEPMMNFSEETKAAAASLTDQERDGIAAAVGMFQPYAGKITGFLGVTPPGIIADQVAGYIGPEMVDSVQALATVAETRPAILGLIHERLASTEGLELVRALAAKLELAYPQSEE